MDTISNNELISNYLFKGETLDVDIFGNLMTDDFFSFINNNLIEISKKDIFKEKLCNIIVDTIVYTKEIDLVFLEIFQKIYQLTKIIFDNHHIFSLLHILIFKIKEIEKEDNNVNLTVLKFLNNNRILNEINNKEASSFLIKLLYIGSKDNEIKIFNLLDKIKDKEFKLKIEDYLNQYEIIKKLENSNNNEFLDSLEKDDLIRSKILLLEKNLFNLNQNTENDENSIDNKISLLNNFKSIISQIVDSNNRVILFEKEEFFNEDIKKLQYFYTLTESTNKKYNKNKFDLFILNQNSVLEKVILTRINSNFDNKFIKFKNNTVEISSVNINLDYLYFDLFGKAFENYINNTLSKLIEFVSDIKDDFISVIASNNSYTLKTSKNENENLNYYLNEAKNINTLVHAFINILENLITNFSLINNKLSFDENLYDKEFHLSKQITKFLKVLHSFSKERIVNNSKKFQEIKENLNLNENEFEETELITKDLYRILNEYKEKLINNKKLKIYCKELFISEYLCDLISNKLETKTEIENKENNLLKNLCIQTYKELNEDDFETSIRETSFLLILQESLGNLLFENENFQCLNNFIEKSITKTKNDKGYKIGLSKELDLSGKIVVSFSLPQLTKKIVQKFIYINDFSEADSFIFDVILKLYQSYFQIEEMNNTPIEKRLIIHNNLLSISIILSLMQIGKGSICKEIIRITNNFNNESF